MRFDLFRGSTPAWTRTPGINRFAAAQALAGAADALVAVSLAGSLFFNISPDASRQQVLIYLLVNMAPFALLAPLVGPAIDSLERGHRWIAGLLFILRAACAVGLAFTLLDLALYFFALALLVFAKASGVTRQALVPGLVADREHLVAANSRLARLNVLAGAVGGAIGGAVVALGSSTIALGLAAACFVGAAVATSRVPDPFEHEPVAVTVEYEELHAPRIVATAWAFTVVRAAVGFFTFGLAFALRRGSQPAWIYAAAVAAYGVGTFGGNVVAPLLRQRYREVGLVSGSLIALAGAAAFGALGPSRPLVLTVAVVLGAAASVGRQGFDSLVQSQAPEASRGRSFARFETRFQIGWVLGAVAATAASVPIQISMAVLAATLVPAAVLYLRSIREAREAHVADPFDPMELARRRLQVAAEWHRRGLDRVVASELQTTLELVRATGVSVDPSADDAVDRLRDGARAGDQLDGSAIERALDAVALVVVTASGRPRFGQGVDVEGGAGDVGSGSSGAPSSPPSPPSGAGGGSLSSSRIVVPVTDHSSCVAPNMTTWRRKSRSDQ